MIIAVIQCRNHCIMIIVPYSIPYTMQFSILYAYNYRVTTESGNQWLIHKGDGYGKSSQTVVVDAKHMSDDWKVKLMIKVLIV